MEEPVKDQNPVSENSGGKSASKLLRYPLRSGTKAKEERPPVADSSNSSASRGRSASSVSKSVGVLDLSAKDKSAKPPRRLSIPAKSSATPVRKSVGNITPISEARGKRSAINIAKSESPVSDVSKSSSRRRFNLLSSASHWISQIKLSESADKHSISLGFFKLALEAGCEPIHIDRLRDELKSYARRHSLVELGERVTELFESYGILENFEQLQVSETCSHVPEEGTRSSDDDLNSNAVGSENQKAKPKSLNTDAIDPVREPEKEITLKTATKIRASANKGSASSKSASEVRGQNTQKKSQKQSKQESNKEKDNIKKQGKKSAHEKSPINTAPVEEAIQDNKENLDALQMKQISSAEV